MFPDSYQDKKSLDKSNKARVTSGRGDKVTVPKVKSTSKERKGGSKCNSKVRRKGEAIIEQLL